MLGLVIILPIVSSFIIFFRYSEKKDPVNIVIVQPNLDPWKDKFRVPVSKQIDDMLALAHQNITNKTDLVLFPETAISSPIEEGALDNMGSIYKVRNFSNDHQNVPILIGADTYGLFKEERPFPARKIKDFWYESYNTALLVDANNPIDVYHKAKLVLGAEKLPFVDIFPFIAKWSVSLNGAGSILVSNPYPQNFSASGIQFAPLICYESVYGEYTSYFTRKGAEILCVITNDGWWGKTPGYRQHLFFSQIRAIENRRPVIRSANTGISCIINQRGEIENKLDYDVIGAIKGVVNKNDSITFFVKYGDLIGRVCEFLFLGLLLLSITNYLKSKKSKINE